MNRPDVSAMKTHYLALLIFFLDLDSTFDRPDVTTFFRETALPFPVVAASRVFEAAVVFDFPAVEGALDPVDL